MTAFDRIKDFLISEMHQARIYQRAMIKELLAKGGTVTRT